MTPLASLTIPILGLPAVLAGGWAGYEGYTSLATKAYVAHYVAEQQQPIQADLNTIVSGQIALQLQELYRARCNGYSSISNDQLIEQLRGDYHRRTGRAYVVPSCDFLQRAGV